MSLHDLIQGFEDAKQRIDSVLEHDPKILPMFRVENTKSGHFVGDGFFYKNPNTIVWKYGGSGHESDATPEYILDSYRYYKQRKMGMEDALTDAIKALDDWYNELRKE